MTMTIFHAVNMPMGFVVLFAFSTSFSSSENHVMHPVRVSMLGRNSELNRKSIPVNGLATEMRIENGRNERELDRE